MELKNMYVLSGETKKYYWTYIKIIFLDNA